MAKHGDDSHRWYVFEAEAHRLQKSLSDLDGTDPKIHSCRPLGVLQEIANALTRSRHHPTVIELEAILGDLNKAAVKIKRELRTNPCSDRARSRTSSWQRRLSPVHTLRLCGKLPSGSSPKTHPSKNVAASTASQSASGRASISSGIRVPPSARQCGALGAESWSCRRSSSPGEPSGHFLTAQQVTKIGRATRANLQVPALLIPARGHHRALHRRSNPNLMTVLRHPPGDAVALNFAPLRRQLDGIGMANQVMGELIEAYRQGAVIFRAHPGVAPMVEQIIGEVDAHIPRASAFAGSAANSAYWAQWRQSNALGQIRCATLPANSCRQRRSASGSSAKFNRQHVSAARWVRKSEAVRQTARTNVDAMVNTTAANKERKMIWPGLQ